jgi:hypothetical protein
LPEAQKILKLQRDASKALQGLSRRDGEKLCASLESADELGVQKFLDPKAIEPLLTPQQRELLGAFGIDLSKVDVAKIMRLLGVDLSQADLAKLTQQCRESQGELGRFATRELNRVEEQLFRCDDRVLVTVATVTVRIEAGASATFSPWIRKPAQPLKS